MCVSETACEREGTRGVDHTRGPRRSVPRGSQRDVRPQGAARGVWTGTGVPLGPGTSLRPSSPSLCSLPRGMGATVLIHGMASSTRSEAALAPDPGSGNHV